MNTIRLFRKRSLLSEDGLKRRSMRRAYAPLLKITQTLPDSSIFSP